MGQYIARSDDRPVRERLAIKVIAYFKQLFVTDHLFFAAYGAAAWAILALVSLYRLSDIVMGMANPLS